jgi:myo-inositol 2-dehydrogenase/D-chiro-inositol 1-dehydrogenase
VLRAAAAGRAIFCEKPLDLELGRIDAVLAAVARAGVPLMLGFNRRFDPDFARVQALVAAGAIGRPEMLRITSRDPSPPPLPYVRVSGGLFLDMAIHDFDMARFVLGEVEEVFAVGAALVDPAIGEAGDVDSAITSLRFASGALGLIENSRRVAWGYDQRLEVLGSLGTVANANHSADSVVLATAAGFVGPVPLGFFMDRYVPAYEAEIRAFVRCLVEDRPVPVGGRDGRAAVVLGLAARRSLLERRPVRVSELDR